MKESDKQFEECIGNLEHEDMRMIMLVADKDTFTSSSHSMFFIVLLQPAQTSRDRRIFFGLMFFYSKVIIAQWI